MAKPRYTSPTATEFEQVIDARPVNLPNCKRLNRCVIKAGPRHYKLASILEFTNPETGDVSSRQLNLNTFPFTVTGGMDYASKGRVGSWHCENDEIARLRAFLEAADDVQEMGRHTVVPKYQGDAFKAFLDKLGNTDLSTPQLLDLISALSERASDIRQLPQLGEENKLRMVAAAIRVAHRQVALAKLQQLIDTDAVEEEFQKLLNHNWWMLGSHYIEHIDRRQWTNEETLDIMLRTADNYFEIIELKRSTAQLFKEDHGKWIVSSAVNDAVNQAAHYITEIERQQSVIHQRYDVDLYKLKAKVLIGYIPPDEPDIERKRAALRMYNSHLHRIEVISFDGLMRTAENVINANAGESGQASDLHVDLNAY